MKTIWAALVSVVLLVVVPGQVWPGDLPEGSAPPSGGESATEPGRSWGVVPLPIIAYSPDFGGMFGAMAIFFYGPDVGVPPEEQQGLRNNTVASNAIITTNGSYLSVISATNYLKEERFRWDNSLVGNQIPRSFFGIGPDADDEEKYTALTLGASSSFTVQTAPDLFVGPLYEYRRVTIQSTESGGELRTGNLAGSGTHTVKSGLGVRVIWDTTGGVFWPESGFFVDAGTQYYPRELGSTYTFGLYGVDMRRYFSVWNNHVLALQGRFYGSWGTTPFHFLPSVGGNGTMRGVLEHRYRDDVAVTVQAEYRLPITDRFGVVAFGSLGQVAESFPDLDATDPAIAGGVGFRVALNREQKLNLRIDIAFSPMGLAPYLNAREAF